MENCASVTFVNELRIDGFFVIAVTAAAILGIGSLKLVALSHHQHPIAQGFLVLF